MAKKIIQSSNFLTDVEIKNFKSIKHLKFKPKRVNLFIGKPNSGKSNLLEALSLLGEVYLQSNNENVFRDLVRFEKTIQIFYNQNLSENIDINTNLGCASLRYTKNNNCYDFIISPTINDQKKLKALSPHNTLDNVFKNYWNNNRSNINPNMLEPYFRMISEIGNSYRYDDRILRFADKIKKYDFKGIKEYSDKYSLFLLRNGENLYTILEMNEYLRDVAGDFFEEYNMQFIMISGESKFVIQRKMGKVVYQLPLLMTPDTFQRLLYYLAAIYSNSNSVLLFEEPEAHSFPPYIAMICELIAKKPENQYFISTHSPYVYQSIVSKTDKTNLGVWALSYSNDQTQMVQLTEKQVSETLGEGIDIFSNIERYTK